MRLDSYIHQNKIDIQVFLQIAIELCKLIESFHKQSKIFGDLKTSSFIVNDDNHTISCAFVPNSQTSNLTYQAPEQDERLNIKLDALVDIYGLGIILYELLSSKIEYDEEHGEQYFYELLMQQMPPLYEKDPSIPLIISKIIDRMIAKDRNERYHSIFSVLVDLTRCYQQLQYKNTLQEFELDTFKPFISATKTNIMYGRSAEEDELSQIMHNISSKNNRLISIFGNSGVGKSSFVNDALKKYESSFGGILELKLEKYHQNAPYEILYEALRDLTKQLILTQDEQVFNLYKEKLQAVFGVHAQILIDVIPEIEVILGKQPKVTEVNPADKKARFDNMLLNFMKLLFESEKPFCIFIDDLQWADEIIIQWLQNILFNMNNLFVFISYRDEEVCEEHFIPKMFHELESMDIKIDTFNILPLTVEDIQALLKDSLQLEDSRKIAETIFQKTGGNTFFIHQYIKQLQANGTIRFNLDLLQWQCDLQRLNDLSISDNVFDVLSQRIDLLEKNTYMLLAIASCLGSSFNILTLQKVFHHDPLFEETLHAVLKDEWLLSKEDESQTTFSFSHDKMQEAIYSRLEPDLKKQLHYEIGTYMLQNRLPLENKTLIACVNHLNIGTELFNDRHTLIRLNLDASLHSKASGDFANALLYVKKAMELMPHTEQEVLILKERAECEHLCHNSKEALAYYEKALALSSSKMQKAQIYELLIKFYADISDFQKAYETGRTATAMFGFQMPKSFVPPLFIFDFLKLKIQYRGKNVTDILQIENSQDEEFIAMVKLAANSLQSAYQIRPELCVANALKIVTLCLQKGLTKESVIAFTVFGVIFQGGILANHKLGFEYYLLSMELLKRFNNTVQHAEVKFVSGYFATSWKLPAVQTEELWKEAYENGMQIGDWFHTGCAIAASLQSMFMRGVDLDTILEKSTRALLLLKSIGMTEQYGSVESIRQAVLNLKGKTDSPLSFDTATFNETLYVAKLKDYTSKHFAHYYYVNKITTLYMHQRYKDAFLVSQKAKSFAVHSKGMLHSTEHIFYEALSAARLAKNTTWMQQARYIKILRKAKNRFYAWAEECAENFLSRAYLLEAELYRLQGDRERVFELYDKAQKIASIYMQTNIVVIANLLAKQLYEELKQTKAASAYAAELSKALKTWGVASVLQESADFKNDFNIRTLIETSQIIVKEQRLSKLLEALTKVIIKHFGAQNIFLLLKNDDDFFIEAEFSASSEKLEVMQHQLFKESQHIVHPIVNYVLRTQKPIIIENLSENKIFYDINDTYKNKKSLLCAPLILQGETKGIIYLENNILTEVFTEEKTKFLQYLSGQIAISIENALVYNNLENKVQTRTKELEEANKKLEKLSTTDPLTEISNRRHFESYIQDIWKIAKREHVPISLVMCDIDYFKKINDTYGHIIGDKVLKNVAGIIKNSIQRETDMAARYGGEEFIVILYNTDVKGATQVCKTISTELKENTDNFHIDGVHIDPFTISFGICSSIPDKKHDYNELIKTADTALYEAKLNGRNRIAVKKVFSLD